MKFCYISERTVRDFTVRAKHTVAINLKNSPVLLRFNCGERTGIGCILKSGTVWYDEPINWSSRRILNAIWRPKVANWSIGFSCGLCCTGGIIRNRTCYTLCKFMPLSKKLSFLIIYHYLTVECFQFGILRYLVSKYI